MKRFLKYLLILCTSFIVFIELLIYFSPYGEIANSVGRCLEEKILINTSVSNAYNYLGDSKNAAEWSVYVSHITPVNINDFEDGEQGSIRRCFKNKDESVMFWDEEILVNEKNKIRQLSIFNMNGFSLDGDNLLTEQIYNQHQNQCELTFKLYFTKGKSNWLDELKMYLAGYEVSKVFKENLKQIKINLEQK